MSSLKCSFFLNLVRLTLFLVDYALDFQTLAMFYRKEDYWSFGVLLVVIVGSAYLTLVFSYLWYKDDEFKMTTNLERILRPGLLVLHIFSAGIYVRHAGVVMASLENIRFKSPELTKIIKYRHHDLQILQIFEAFSESVPQIVLMLTVALRDECWALNYLTVMKILVSVLSIVFAEVRYYDTLLSFLPQDHKQKWKVARLVFYFSCKLLLLLSRLMALALFASVFPCFFFTHFICSWLLMCCVTINLETSLMESTGGRRLFRGTLALIWYFSWFSWVERKRSSGEGRRRWQSWKKMAVYHTWMLLDMCVLCGLWGWNICFDPPHSEISCPKVSITAGCVPAGYVFGLLLTLVYFHGFHPDKNRRKQIRATIRKKQQDPSSIEEQQETSSMAPSESSVKRWQYATNPDAPYCPKIPENLVCYLIYAAFNKCSNKLDLNDFKELDVSENKRMEALALNFYQ